MFKWIKIIVALVIVTPVVAAVGLVTLVDPNDYKPEIQQLVKDKTGRDLTIKGDIGISLYPKLGFEADGLVLANHPDFSDKPMLDVGHVEASLKLLPLLATRLEVGKIALSDAQLVAGVNQNGTPSWADMLKTSETASAAEQQEGNTQLPYFELAEVVIDNASLLWIDKPAQSRTEISPFTLSTGEVKPGESFELLLDAKLKQQSSGQEISADIDAKTTVKLSEKLTELNLSQLALNADASIAGMKPLEAQINGDVVMALDGNSIDIKNLAARLNNSQVNGVLSANKLLSRPKLRAVLDIDQLALDDFIEASEADAEQDTSQESGAADFDFSALKTFDAVMQLNIGKLTVSPLNLTEVKTTANINRGVVVISPLQAKGYAGEVKAKVQLDANKQPAEIVIQQQMTGIDAAAFQNDLMEKAWVKGAVNVTADLSTKGLNEQALRENLNGTVSLNFADGALNGLNIAGVLRKAWSVFRQETNESADVLKVDAADTDFSDATASFIIKNGVMSNNDLLVQSPLLRITGEGVLNLAAMSIDYQAKPILVETLKGQGGEAAGELKGIPIPITCTGSLTAPSCKTDYEGFVKTQLKNRLEQEKAELQADLEAKKAEAEAKLRAEKERLEAELEAKKAEANARLEAEKEAAKAKLEAEKAEAEAKAKQHLEEKAKEYLKLFSN